jgi:hypothetical protein
MALALQVKCRVLCAAFGICGVVVLALAVSGAEGEGNKEEDNIDAIRARALLELKQQYPEGISIVVRRDAHAKAHGCVKATFKVDADLETGLRVGTFSTPGKASKAWLRFSNGAFHPGADTGLDGRGMAIKLMDSSGTDPRTVHDILMINHPVFFSPNIADYRSFADDGALTGASAGLRHYFIPSLNPWTWRLRQALIAYRIVSHEVVSPLTAQYYSMTPYQFGPDRTVKYAARPCARDSTEVPATAEKSPNFLREAMQRQLAKKGACFDLLVQMRKAGMSIDDATEQWSETESPFRRVGQILIPPQLFSAPERDRFCEDLSFNPWNAPTEHLPVGGMNRVRKAVYDDISAYRKQRNNVIPQDPETVWDAL